MDGCGHSENRFNSAHAVLKCGGHGRIRLFEQVSGDQQPRRGLRSWQQHGVYSCKHLRIAREPAGAIVAGRQRHRPVQQDRAMGGPDAVKAAEAGGQADRPTRVGSERKIHRPRRGGGGRAAAGAARNANRSSAVDRRAVCAFSPARLQRPANAGRRWPSWSERGARPGSPGCLLRSASRQRRTGPSRQSANRPAGRRLGSGVRPDHAHRPRRPTPAWSIRAAAGGRPAVRTSGGRACSRKAEMPARLRPERWSCSQARQRPPPSRAPVRNRRAAGA